MIDFGTIAGMDYDPQLRVMLIGRDINETHKRSMARGVVSEVWQALVLRDTTWPVGLIVTVAPDMSGFTIIGEEGE